MILEAETLLKYGYLPMDLLPHSHKSILAVCDRCGKIRKIMKKSYRTLCGSCAQKGRIFTEERKANISAALKGKTLTEETKALLRESHKGKHLTEETKALQSAATKGDKHWNWRNGISFEPYCIKFNNHYKNSIRTLFGNECFLCGKSEVDNGCKLCAHHANYNKNCGCDGTNCICVPLCISCHSKTNADRDFWQCLIMEMLKPFEAWEN